MFHCFIDTALVRRSR